jgi:hypothetical protein
MARFKVFANEANKSKLNSQINATKLNSGNACCQPVQNLLCFRLMSKNVNAEIYRATNLPT